MMVFWITIFQYSVKVISHVAIDGIHLFFFIIITIFNNLLSLQIQIVVGISLPNRTITCINLLYTYCNRTCQVVNRCYLMHQSFYCATIVKVHDSWLITTPTNRKLIVNWQNSSHPIFNSWSFWWWCLVALDKSSFWSFIMSVYEIRESQVFYSSLTPPSFFILFL